MKGTNETYWMNGTVSLFSGMGLLLLFAGSLPAFASEHCEGMHHLSDTGPFHICMVPDGSLSFATAHLDRVRVNARPVGSSSSTSVGRPAGRKYPVGPEQKKGLRERLRTTYLEVLGELGKEDAEAPGDAQVLVRGRLADLYFEVPTDPVSGVKNLFAVRARGELELELIDRETGEVVLNAFSSMVSQPADNELDAQSVALEEVAARWGEMLEASMVRLAGVERGQ